MPKKTKLKNGLLIITEENPNIETMVAAVGIKVGSLNESKQEEGLSHALEHMLFKGTKTRTGEELNETVDFLGAQTNAFTSEEETVYYIKGLKDHLKVAIEILADQVLNSIFPAEEMKKEMEVIEQEIKRSYDDPNDMVFEGFKKVAFKNSSLAHPILGTAQQVLAYKPENMIAYYSKHYRCKNMILSVSGNIKHAEVLEYAKEFFKDKGNYKEQKIKKIKWNFGESLVHSEKQNQVIVVNAWPTTGRNKSTKEERTALRLMDAILSSGMSSKLFKEIREKRGLVYSISSYIHHYDDLGYLAIVGGTDYNKIEEYLETIAMVLRNFNKELTEHELQKAKNDLKAKICMQRENNASVAFSNLDAINLYGKISTLKEQLKLIDSIRLNDIKKIMTKILKNRSVLSIYGYCPQIKKGEISLENFEKELRR